MYTYNSAKCCINNNNNNNEQPADLISSCP